MVVEGVDITVVVPTIGRRSLAAAILSADVSARFAGLSAEIIVIDDRSNPRAPLRVPDGLLSEIRVLETGGRGLSSARNAGLRTARGEYVLLLDDDDAVCRHHVKNLADMVDRSVGAAGAYSATATVTCTLTELAHVRTDETVAFGWPYNELQMLVTNYIPPTSVMLLNRMQNGHLMFDSSLLVQEDWDAWLRLQTCGNWLAFSDSATAAYSKNAITNDSMTVRAVFDPAAMSKFYLSYRELCRRYPSEDGDVSAGRNRMAERYREWLRLLAGGSALPLNYYELALVEELGQIRARACCELAPLLVNEPANQDI